MKVMLPPRSLMFFTNSLARCRFFSEAWRSSCCQTSTWLSKVISPKLSSLARSPRIFSIARRVWKNPKNKWFVHVCLTPSCKRHCSADQNPSTVHSAARFIMTLVNVLLSWWTVWKRGEHSGVCCFLTCSIFLPCIEPLRSMTNTTFLGMRWMSVGEK